MLVTLSAGVHSKSVSADSNGMIELTKANSNAIEYLISVNFNYTPDKAYWKFIQYGGRLFGLSHDQLSNIFWEIKIANSIQYVTRSYANILADNIFETKAVFSKFISDLKAGSHQVVTDMVNGLSKQDKATHQLSWCSKICKYLECWDNWGGKTNPDYPNKYAVYDSFVRTVLPYYFKKYGVLKPAKYSYRLWTPNGMSVARMWSHYDEYNQAIDLLLKALKLIDNQTLSKYRLDHILWYYFKKRKQQELSSFVSSLIH
jgi:hypothetical protein